MKLNWGNSIVIAFAAFIAFILYFVVLASTRTANNHELVTESYYERELLYQKEIDAETNANQLKTPVTVSKTDQGLLIRFPKEFKNKTIDGTVSLYRPSNKHLDFDLPLSLSNSHLLIPDKRLLDGRWDIKIFWKHGEKDYLHKEQVYY